MSALPKQYASVSDNTIRLQDIAIPEGDWAAFLRATAGCRDEVMTPKARDEMIAYKRACALAYMGRRAQKCGGVCNRLIPRIFSEQAVITLGKSNAEVRYQRYPWLEKLLKLMVDIELIQDEISAQANVISLTGNTSGINRNVIAPQVMKTASFPFESPAHA
jgi:hypothetical protein